MVLGETPSAVKTGCPQGASQLWTTRVVADRRPRALSTTKPYGQPCTCVFDDHRARQSHAVSFSVCWCHRCATRRVPPLCRGSSADAELLPGVPINGKGWLLGVEMLLRPRVREYCADATLSAGGQRPSRCVVEPGADNGIKKRRSCTTRVRASPFTKRSSRLAGKVASLIVGMKFPRSYCQSGVWIKILRHQWRQRCNVRRATPRVERRSSIPLSVTPRCITDSKITMNPV